VQVDGYAVPVQFRLQAQQEQRGRDCFPVHSVRLRGCLIGGGDGARHPSGVYGCGHLAKGCLQLPGRRHDDFRIAWRERFHRGLMRIDGKVQRVAYQRGNVRLRFPQLLLQDRLSAGQQMLLGM
jgi:hypothetical protein